MSDNLRRAGATPLDEISRRALRQMLDVPGVTPVHILGGLVEALRKQSDLDVRRLAAALDLVIIGALTGNIDVGPDGPKN